MTESKSDEELVQQYCLSCIQCDRSTDDEQEDNYKINMKLQTDLLSRLAKGRAAMELVENLKCCGNCIIDGDDCDYRGHSPQRYCDRYMSDDLTRKERE
jgi:hypothetical protein